MPGQFVTFLIALVVLSCSLTAAANAQSLGPMQIHLDKANATSGAEVRSGLVTVRLKYHKAADGDALRVPVLEVEVEGKQVARIEDGGNGSDWPPALAQIAEMDGSNPYPEIVFSTFTGGAHCCNDVRIVTSSKDGAKWSTVGAGSYDGFIKGVEDADFDGVFEIVRTDNAFLYAFSSYAGSFGPQQVRRLKGGKLVEATFDQGFIYLHRERLALLKGRMNLSEPKGEKNGVLAGYVALKHLVGEGPEGWKFMLANYDKTSDTGLTNCSGGYDANNKCKKEQTFPDYPAALRYFLTDLGYMKK